MSWWRQITGFVRAFRSADGKTASRAPDSLARTIKHSTQLRGGAGGAVTTVADGIMADGHERYAESFEKEN